MSNVEVTRNGSTVSVAATRSIVAAGTPVVLYHNDIRGRSDANAHPAAAITNTPAGTIAATNVQAAINELATDAQTEAGVRAAADTALAASVTAEASTRASADSALAASVAAETSARSGADTTIQANVDAEVSRAEAAEAAIASDLTTETARAEAAEASISSDVSAEATARAAADSAESTTRAAADSTLTTNLASEASARAAADALLQPLSALLTSLAGLTMTAGALLYGASGTTLSALANGTGWLHNNGAGVLAYSTPTYSDVGAEAAGVAAGLLAAHVAAGDPHTQYRLESASVPWSEISGTPTTLAGYGITDPIVLTSGSYANPAWITSLAWGKITGAPTTLSGYGITDAQPLDSDLTAIAALATTSFGRGLLAETGAASIRATIAAEYTSNKGIANGYASLDSGGKIPTSQLPALAITDTFVVASQAAMLALTAETGDIAVRTDLNKSYILRGTSPSTLGDWQELLTPTDTVLSVNGYIGAVTIGASDLLTGTLPDARLANVITAGGPTGSASVVPIITWDAHGRLTAVSSASIAIAAGAVSGLATVATSGSASDLGSGTLAAARGGTGVSNAGTLTNASNTTITGGGTLVLGGFTLTVPATLTAAGLGIANIFTATQTVDLGTGALPGSATLYLATTDGAAVRQRCACFGNTGGTLFDFYSAGTTRAGPSATPNGSFFLTFEALGFGTGANQRGAYFAAVAGSLWSSTNRETYWVWAGTVAGSTTNAEWMRLQGGASEPGGSAALLLGGASLTTGNGLLQLASGTTQAYGWSLGTDVHGFRNAANAITIDATAGLSLTGNLILGTAGLGLSVKEGTNATMGVATLVGGTVTVSTTKVTANSRIFYAVQSQGGTIGSVEMTARSAGTSFTLTSTNILDTSVVAWWIVEPA